jgi:hypothetical protein
VRVHPADIDLARKHLSDAEIVPMETITGGMDAAMADGTIRVINTFRSGWSWHGRTCCRC